MPHRRYLPGLALLLLSPLCLAEPEAAPQEKPAVPAKIEIGATTDALLNLQRSEMAAAPVLPMQGEVASRAYTRYLDSFRPAMPGQGEATGAATGASRASSPVSNVR